MQNNISLFHYDKNAKEINRTYRRSAMVADLGTMSANAQDSQKMVLSALTNRHMNAKLHFPISL
jgi:hypothetical protein